MDYFVTLIAHIDEFKRPTHFPKQVSATILVQVENDMHELQTATNDMASRIIRAGGMIVENPVTKGTAVKGITKETFDYDHNIFVPLHMITHIESATSVRIETQPDPGAEGEPLVKLQ
jgi:hypothetical protein